MLICYLQVIIRTQDQLSTVAFFSELLFERATTIMRFKQHTQSKFNGVNTNLDKISFIILLYINYITLC